MRGSWRHRGVTVERLATDTMVQRTRDPFGRDGFEEFVHATADRLYRSALLMCGDHHLAEDLTQTTYAKVYSHWSKVVAADSPLAYSRTILTRTFLSHRRLRRSGEQPVDTLPDRPTSGPDMAMRVDLLAALRQLPPGTVRCWCCATGRTSPWSARPRSSASGPRHAATVRRGRWPGCGCSFPRSPRPTTRPGRPHDGPATAHARERGARGRQHGAARRTRPHRGDDPPPASPHQDPERVGRRASWS